MVRLITLVRTSSLTSLGCDALFGTPAPAYALVISDQPRCLETPQLRPADVHKHVLWGPGGPPWRCQNPYIGWFGEDLPSTAGQIGTEKWYRVSDHLWGSRMVCLLCREQTSCWSSHRSPAGFLMECPVCLFPRFSTKAASDFWASFLTICSGLQLLLFYFVIGLLLLLIRYITFYLYSQSCNIMLLFFCIESKLVG